MKLVKAFRYLILGAVGLAVTAIPIFDIALIVMNTFGLIAMKWDDVLIAGLSIAQTMARNMIRSGLGGVK